MPHLLEWFEKFRETAQRSYPQARAVTTTIAILAPGVLGQVAVFGDDPRAPVAGLSTQATPCTTVLQVLGELAKQVGVRVRADADITRLDVLLADYRQSKDFADKVLAIVADEEAVTISYGGTLPDGQPDAGRVRHWRSEGTLTPAMFDAELRKMLDTPGLYPTLAELAAREVDAEHDDGEHDDGDASPPAEGDTSDKPKPKRKPRKRPAPTP